MKKWILYVLLFFSGSLSAELSLQALSQDSSPPTQLFSYQHVLLSVPSKNLDVFDLSDVTQLRLLLNRSILNNGAHISSL